MSHGPVPSLRALVLACSTAFLLAAAQPAPGQSGPTAPPYVYVGTVHAVQADGKALDLITGVGYALRVVHIRLVPATQAVSAGAAISMASVATGDILRADCHSTDAGLVADKIERLAPAGAGPEHQP
jgi:hypothetical protein